MTKNTAWRPVALSLTVLGALARLIPHPPNFAPVGATSLFAGARLPVWQAYLVPLVLMAITDPILAAFYGVPAYGKFQLFIYGSFLISVWLGRRLRNTQSVPRIAAFALANSIQFFLITNFPSWAMSNTYPRTLAGLATATPPQFLSSVGQSPAICSTRESFSASTPGLAGPPPAVNASPWRETLRTLLEQR